MKKTLLLLCGLLLLAGCQGESEQESSAVSTAASSEESLVSAESSRAESSYPSEISLPEELFTSSEEEASLPVTPDPITLRGVLRFTFPEGWQNQGDSDSLFAVSPDGTASVQGSFTPLATMQGITGEMLASSAAPALQKAWEDSGVSGVAYDVAAFFPEGTPYSTVALQGVLEGTAVFQWQIYVPLTDGYLTLTVTAYDQDIRADLMKHFSAL